MPFGKQVLNNSFYSTMGNIYNERNVYRQNNEKIAKRLTCFLPRGSRGKKSLRLSASVCG